MDIAEDEYPSSKCFIALNPIIRSLLHTIQVAAAMQSSCVSDNDFLLPTSVEDASAVLRAERTLLVELREALSSLTSLPDEPCESLPAGSGDNNARRITASSTVATELIVMAEFVLLPPKIILQRQTHYHKFWRKRYFGKGGNEGLVDHGLLALFSLEKSVQEHSAIVLSAFFDGICRVAGGKKAIFEGLAKSTVPVGCLTACAMSLPTVSAEGSYCGDLDRGEECNGAILKAVVSLVSLCAEDRCPKLSMAIREEKEGALLFQLIQSCLDAVSGGDEITGGNGCAASEQIRGMSKSANKEREAVRNAGLAGAALSALMALMNGVQFRDCWRRIFPGCFTILYKLAISQTRQSPSPPKLLASSIDAVSCLLGVTLKGATSNAMVGRDAHYASDATALTAQNTTNKASDHRAGDILDSAGMKLRRVTDTGLDLQSTTGISESSAKFVTEVRSRLPLPLSLIIGMSSSHSSPTVRRSGVSLCQRILVDGEGVWEKGRVGLNRGAPSVQETAMESCVALLRDDDDSVVSLATEVIASVRSNIGEMSWRAMISESVVPRILELVEEIPLLASSGREKEIKYRMDLVSGYLAHSLVCDQDCTQTDGDGNRNAYGIHSPVIGVALSCSAAARSLIFSLAIVLSLDLDAEPIGQPAVSSLFRVVQGIDVDTSTGKSTVPPYRFLHLRKVETCESAISMLHLLGAALGMRECIAFVETCMTELCDGCSMESANAPLYGRCQVKWLHKSTGLVVLANEVLCGGFGSLCGSDDLARLNNDGGNSDMPRLKPSLQFVGNGCSSNRQSLVAARSLCNSILPLVFSQPLWRIPTTLEEIEFTDCYTKADCRFPEEDVHDLHEYLSQPSAPRLEKFSTSRRGAVDGFLAVEVSASALRGNALVLANLLSLIGRMCDCLGAVDAVNEFLPVILYPVLEKVNCHGNHLVVQRAAIHALTRVSFAAKLDGSVKRLLAKNMDYLSEAVVSRLRVPGGGSKFAVLPRSLPGVVEVIMRSASSSGDCPSDAVLNGQSSVGNNMWLVNDVVEAVLPSFDRLITGPGFGSSSRDVVHKNHVVSSVIRLLDATIEYLQKARRHSSGGHHWAKTHGCKNDGGKDGFAGCEKGWVDSLLIEFASTMEESSEVDDDDDRVGGLSPEEGFAQLYENEKVIDARNDPGEEKPTLKSSSEEGVTPLGVEVEICKQIMSRCVFFLSLPNLIIQVSAADVLLRGFKFLAQTDSTQSRHGHVPPGSTAAINRVGSQLLPAIYEFWHAIRARLASTINVLVCAAIEKNKDRTLAFNLRRALSSSSSRNEKRSGGIGDETANSSFSTVLLRSLLAIVSVLCELSGDFMRQRFENDVWPQIAKLLRCYLHPQTSESPAGVRIKGTIPNRQRASLGVDDEEWATGYCGVVIIRGRTDETEVLSLLQCISRVFAASECGSSLSHLVPVVGTMLLPFLAEKGTVGAAALMALKSLLRIDCDCLWRGLTVLSGETVTILPNVLAPPKCGVGEENARERMWKDESLSLLEPQATRSCEEESLKKNAKALLDFIHRLDEQQIL